MELEHNSHRLFFRSPYGAVTCNTEVCLRLSVYNAGLPHYVRLVYKCDSGEEVYTDMPYVFSVMGSSIYEKTIKMPKASCLVWYRFEIETDEGIIYYGDNREHLGGMGMMSLTPDINYFQITVYDEKYQTPEWFKSAVAYQIFPDRFFNGNEDGSFSGSRTDIIKRRWGEQPFYKAEQFGGEYKSNDFFGGNLKGIIKKLSYLEELGITVIYLNPIFKAASNHKYDTGSYEEIDPMFGDEKTFAQLCAEAKKHNIRIILDGVFNHTGDDSLYFNKYGNYDSIGAYQSKQSPYYSWFNFIDFPDEYESWWGMKTLPQVDETCESLRKYLLSGENSIIKKWIRLGASGWRLDVVDELPDFFVKELRAAVKEVNPEAVIIGEVWEDASNKIAYGQRREYFYGSELDSVMNYPLRNAVIDVVLCRIDAAEFDRRIMSLKENYPMPAYYSLLNILSSHDVERIMTLMGGVPDRHEISRDKQAEFVLDDYTLQSAKKRARIAWGMIMTMPGVPCLFYGDELGVQGYGDPFCRSCFPWDNMDEIDPGQEMRNWIKSLTHLRASSNAMSIGEFETVYQIGHVYVYIRTDGEDKYIMAANFDGMANHIRIDTARFGVTELRTICLADEPENEYKSDDGIFFVTLPSQSFTVYKA
jgi:cyclomaltodextrinase